MRAICWLMVVAPPGGDQRSITQRPKASDCHKSATANPGSEPQKCATIETLPSLVQLFEVGAGRCRRCLDASGAGASACCNASILAISTAWSHLALAASLLVGRRGHASAPRSIRAPQRTGGRRATRGYQL